MRVAIYLHDSQNQNRTEAEGLTTFATQKGWQIVKIYRKKTTKNAAFRSMLKDAKEAQFDVLLFWSLAQFSHDSTISTIRMLNQLNELGIKFQSVSEPHFGTCGTHGKTTALVLTTLAHEEQKALSKRISIRTKAGLARQKAQGIRGPQGHLGPGRPPTQFDERLARDLHTKKKSYAEIAASCHVSKAKIWRYFNLPSTKH
jgi:DNA invertase Pin-like site-specific DNA recombinase